MAMKKNLIASCLAVAVMAASVCFAGMVIDPYGYSTGGAPSFNPASGDYKFNEGTGTTIANAIGTAGTDGTLLTGLNWGSGNYAFLAAEDFETPNGTFYSLGDFTIAVWIAPSTLAASGNIDLALVGNGSSTSGTNTSWLFQATNTTVTASISNSANSKSTLTLSNALDTSHTWLAMFRYHAVGAGTSESYIDITNDCSIWNSTSTTASNLKRNTNTFEFRRTANHSVPAGVAGVYERTTLFGYKLTDAQRDTYCSNGKNASTYN